MFMLRLEYSNIKKRFILFFVSLYSNSNLGIYKGTYFQSNKIKEQSILWSRELQKYSVIINAFFLFRC